MTVPDGDALERHKRQHADVQTHPPHIRGPGVINPVGTRQHHAELLNAVIIGSFATGQGGPARAGFEGRGGGGLYDGQ